MLDKCVSTCDNTVVALICSSSEILLSGWNSGFLRVKTGSFSADGEDEARIVSVDVRYSSFVGAKS